MRRAAALAALACAALCLPGVAAGAQLTPDQAARIRQAAPARPRVKPRKPRTVLVWNTPPSLMEQDPHKGYCIPQGAEAFRVLGDKTGAYRSVVTDDIADLAPDRLKQYDCIVLNNASGPWIRPTEADLPRLRNLGATVDEVTQALRRGFLAWVERGGGIVAIHFAIAGNADWPEFQALLGGKFAGHPWNEEVGLTVEEPGHPLTATFPAAGFRLADEIYEFGEPYDRGKVRVLLSLDTQATNMGVPWINRKDGDFAQAWVKPHGKGRVFYTGFGHRTEVFWDPAVLAFYLDAVQFAAGDLAAPTASRGPRPPERPAPPPGFAPLFDGETLAGWRGDPRVWSVQDGAITGQTTPRVALTENTFLLWKEPVEDFELRLKFRLQGGNSGIYIRSRERPPDVSGGEALVGMQADIDSTGRWNGVLMEYSLRDVLAERGERVTIDEAGKRTAARVTTDPARLEGLVKPGEWNDYTIVARGGRVTLRINGVTTCEVDDRDKRRLVRGALGVQVHVGEPMRVQFKDVWLRRL